MKQKKSSVTVPSSGGQKSYHWFLHFRFPAASVLKNKHCKETVSASVSMSPTHISKLHISEHALEKSLMVHIFLQEKFLGWNLTQVCEKILV